MVKAFKSHYSKRNDDVINTRMVAAVKVAGDKFSMSPMPAEKSVEPGVDDTSCNIVSLSRRLMSMARITGIPYQQVGADTNHVPS